VNWFIGTFQDTSLRFTSSSKASATMRKATTADTGLEIDAAWKSVVVSTRSVFPLSRKPYPLTQSIRPS
jgi:hypothetical protein